MIRVRVLQVGDIHYSLENIEASTVDLKDRLYPAQVAAIATQNPLESTMRLMVDIAERTPIDAIVIVGDLTDKGNLANYQKCVDYLSTNLRIGEMVHPDHVHCVPGNHDVDLRSLDGKTPKPEAELWEKFQTLNTAWTDRGLDILATREVRATSIKKGLAELEIVSLNSCVGCGEYRGLSDATKKALRANANAEDNNQFWSLMEQLDTPCFASNHLETAVKSIGTPANKLSLLLAHHNLLPQSVPVVAPYVGLLNAGWLRTMLTKGPAPVVYCHGHIHEDPVELIGCASNLPSKLMTVSAPKFDKGFNIIEAHFSDNGVPLGIEVQQFRISSDLPFSYYPSQKIRIPFRGPNQFGALCNEEKANIAEIIRQSTACFASAILRTVNETYPDVLLKDFANLLTELQWHGIVKIDHEEMPIEQWRIRKEGDK